MARYLIKFVSKLEYAEDLRHGKLFMRPAEYYHHLERGQGDEAEAAICHFAAIYKNVRWAIYCMYTPRGADLHTDGSIHISKRVIDDFKCAQGYAVILDRDKFESLLPLVDTGGYQLSAGEIGYRAFTMEDTSRLLTTDSDDNIAVKRPYFHYQKEYRVVIAKSVPLGDDSVIYNLPSALLGDSWIVSIADLEMKEDEYIIPKIRGEIDGRPA